MYRGYISNIECHSDTKINLLDTGQLQVALSEEEMSRIENELVPVWTSEGFTSYVLDRAESLAVEPLLGPGVVGSVLLPVEIAVEPMEIVRALLITLSARPNVTLTNGSMVTKLLSTASHASVVFDDQIVQSFDYVVVAAGLQTPTLVPELKSGIYPMRGQGLELRGALSGYAFRHHIYSANGGPTRSAYMVPRADGRVAGGVTYEPNVGIERVEDQAIESIRRGLAEVCPVTTSWPETRRWAGIRPASIDGIPYIGAVDSGSRLIVCAGHQGLGVTLAPVSAHLVAVLLGLVNAGEREVRALNICNPARHKQIVKRNEGYDLA